MVYAALKQLCRKMLELTEYILKKSGAGETCCLGRKVVLEQRGMENKKDKRYS